jgi:hypothetical protein
MLADVPRTRRLDVELFADTKFAVDFDTVTLKDGRLLAIGRVIGACRRPGRRGCR